jgi:hypothetical protein
MLTDLEERALKVLIDDRNLTQRSLIFHENSMLRARLFFRNQAAGIQVNIDKAHERLRMLNGYLKPSMPQIYRPSYRPKRN